MATVNIQSVSKSLGSSEVIHDISIHVPDRSFVVLVGPSGCGKSTLLRLIAGLEEVTDGIITIDGKVVNDIPPKDRDIAMVFQNYALYPHMTAHDNMAFQMRIRGRPQSEIESKIRQIAETLGLSSFLQRYPKQLSGGQRQRVAMGRALVREPKVFLFDEPLSNIDANLRVQLRSEIRSLQLRLRVTTIYVTHDQLEAMTMGDIIVVMRDGTVEQIGTPLEIFDRPANTFVASFIGSPTMNLLSGTICGNENKLWVDSQAGLLPLSPNMAVLLGRKVLYGIRPSAFLLCDGPNTIKGRIDTVEPTGESTQLHIAVYGQQLVAVFEGRRNFQRDADISLLPIQSLGHLFDAESGKRLEGSQSPKIDIGYTTDICGSSEWLKKRKE